MFIRRTSFPPRNLKLLPPSQPSLYIVAQSLSHVQLCVTPWNEACQTSLFLTISQSFLKFIPIESVMLSNHLILCRTLLLCLQSFPASGAFPMSWLFAAGGQSIGVSVLASILPMHIQGWFPLGLTGLISFLSKGLSRVFSSTTLQKHHSSVLSLLYGLTFTSVHDYWKNNSFNYTDLCQQSDISAF